MATALAQDDDRFGVRLMDFGGGRWRNGWHGGEQRQHAHSDNDPPAHPRAGYRL